MALDWNKEVNLSSLFKKKEGAAQGTSSYPTKTTMNLYQGEVQDTDIRKVVVTGVLLAIGITLFVKFAVLDQLALVSQKQGELAEQQALVMQMQTATADFDEVKTAYDAYQARYGSGTVDAISILDMVEDHVMNVCAVSGITLSDGVLTLTVNDVPLDTVGDLAKDLETQPEVLAVNVSTATTQENEGQNTTATLVVTLVSAQTQEE